MKQPSRSLRMAGFTLVEMLVSLAVLAIILAALAQANTALSNAVSQTTSQMRAFQEARDAFEAMTRRIGQATLNSYNDAPNTTAVNFSYTGYVRASELRFICGPASLSATASNGLSGPLLPTTPGYHPSHAIFFQAPLGKFTSGSATAKANLVQMLNTCGYYIEWNSDSTPGLGLVPTFITGYTPRYRFRLMEMIEPSDLLTIYSDTSGSTGTTPNVASKSWIYSGKDWYTTPFGATTTSIHAVADNVIMLAFLPMVSPQTAQLPQGGAADGTSTDLAPNYIYDTAPPSGSAPNVSTNQLPPMIFVEMIAVDEQTFANYQLRNGNPSTIPSNLGVDSSGSGSFLTNATYTNRQTDVSAVVTALQNAHIKYRIFSTIVPLTAN